MQNFGNGIIHGLMVGFYILVAICYPVGLYAVAKADGIGAFLFTLCVPVLGQLYGVWAGFKFLFL